jgi:hypothetical protein
MTSRELADWVVNTCLMFGTSVGTAYWVAGTYVGSLEDEGAFDKVDVAELGMIAGQMVTRTRVRDSGKVQENG